jgi:hypothetical protein
MSAVSRDPSGSARRNLGLAGGEVASRLALVGAPTADQLHQLGIGVGDRVALFLAAVGVVDPHQVGAVDVDGLDGGVFQQRLEGAKTEPFVVDGVYEPGFQLGGEHVAARARLVGDPIPYLGRDQLSCLFGGGLGGDLVIEGAVDVRDRGADVGLVDARRPTRHWS